MKAVLQISDCEAPLNMSTNSTASIDYVGANVMIDGSVSPSSSGVSSLGSSYTNNHSNSNGSNASCSNGLLMPTSSLSPHLTEAEALLQLSHHESDEGIVSDQSSSADPDDAKRIKVRTKEQF